MRVISILFLIALAGFPAFAQQPSSANIPDQAKAAGTQQLPPDAASKEQLMKLFEVIGVQKQMQSVVNSMADAMQQMMPANIQLSDKHKDEMSKLQAELFSKMMSPEFMNSYLEMMVPVYQVHFTKSDVVQITAFYSSPAGQKFVNEQALITQEIFPKLMPMMQQHMQEVIKETNFEQRMKQIFAEEERPTGPPK